MAEGRNFDLEIITPDRVFYQGQASMIEFNTTEGEIGVYKDHIPLTVIIKPGVLTITSEEDKRKIYEITELGTEVLELELKRIQRLYRTSQEVIG